MAIPPPKHKDNHHTLIVQYSKEVYESHILQQSICSAAKPETYLIPDAT